MFFALPKQFSFLPLLSRSTATLNAISI
jgi:hypothetical protein